MVLLDARKPLRSRSRSRRSGSPCRRPSSGATTGSSTRPARPTYPPSEKGVRLAQRIEVGPCFPVGKQLERATVGPASGPTWRLSLSGDGLFSCMLCSTRLNTVHSHRTGVDMGARGTQDMALLRQAPACHAPICFARYRFWYAGNTLPCDTARRHARIDSLATRR